MKLFRQLFFYSSRQLFRRRRTYAAVFITSVILLTLVTTFLELFESYSLKVIDDLSCGLYHASFRGTMGDYSEKALQNERVTGAWSIPYTSLMASSVDASVPGVITVENDETDKRLGVKYIWGHEPGDGEIAVPESMFRECGYLVAGEVNDLYFKAAEMCYEPLTVCGIYSCNDAGANYAFVTKKTAEIIDRQTRASTSYDLYINCKHATDRYIAVTADELYQSLRLDETIWQKLSDEITDSTYSGMCVAKYREYVNSEYLDLLVSQAAAPLALYSMPVIVIAALMLASFMVSRAWANSPEYGVMSSFGANRFMLCSVPAGQIILISLISAVPVILLSALLSVSYISAFNSASETMSGAGLVYTVPWGRLIEVALLFVFFSGLFTITGLAAMTKEMPFVLISGPYRGEMPFVKSSAMEIAQSRHRIFKVSLLQALRRIKSGVIPAVITSFVCLVCGIFCFVLIYFGGITSSLLETIKRSPADTVIETVDGEAPLTDSDIAVLESVEGIAGVGIMSQVGEHNFLSTSVNFVMSGGTPFVREDVFMYSPDITPEWEMWGGYAANAYAVRKMYGAPIAGSYDDFSDDSVIIAAGSKYAAKAPLPGETIKLTGRYEVRDGSYNVYDEYTAEFRVAAVVSTDSRSAEGRYVFMTSAGAERLGFGEKDRFGMLLVDYDQSLTADEMTAVIDRIEGNPAFLRYKVTNNKSVSSAERAVQTARTVMLCVFFVMVYVSFITMTYTNSLMRSAEEQKEISVIRQLGASDRDVYKTVRTGTYPASVLALIISTFLYIVVTLTWLFSQTSELNKQAHLYPLTFTPEYYAQCREEIFALIPVFAVIFVSAVLLHIISAGVSVLGTIPPTRRILSQSITEGLRKDTD